MIARHLSVDVPHVRTHTGAATQVARKCACSASSAPCATCGEQAASPAVAPPEVHDVVRSSGRPLDAATRDVMAPRFGHDFSRVQLHTDAAAARSARSVGARAYTVGNHVVFADGQFAPHTRTGQHLLAHELAHVVQQPEQIAAKLEVGPVDSPSEREADRIADQVLSGGAVQRPAATASPRLQRTAENDGGPTPANPLPSRIKVWLNAFLPRNVEGATEVPFDPGHFMFPGPLPGRCFHIDGRGFDTSLDVSARAHVEADIDLATKSVTASGRSSETIEYDCKTGSPLCQRTPTLTFSGQPIVGLSRAIFGWSFTAAAHNPCMTGAPDVDVRGVVQVNTSARELSFHGLIEPFPAFEMYASVDGGAAQTIFTAPISPGASPFSLFGDASVVPPSRVIRF